MMNAPSPIQSWQLYGEKSPFPDLLHIERIIDRAAGLQWQIEPHRHLHLHQNFLILGGQARLTLDGEIHLLEPPCLVNVPAGVVHGFTFSAGTEGYVLTLPVSDFPELFGGDSETAPILESTFFAPSSEILADGFSRIAALHKTQGTLRRLRLRAEALTIGCAIFAVAGSQTPGAGQIDPRIGEFGRLIREHLADNWSVADYARELALSERHLRRLCQTATGLGPQPFVEATRLREACRLLAYTRMQVQEVGFALGFEDPAYFGRVFQRGTGKSPGAYRRSLEI
ncbi:helix-turn-helix domain-containing protein [Tabrizicola sp.]|uniref:helix-turn-helix domain-containing protein n=1 Tax=Tabrizicola sp. TaxID=2005166 RepID=UPI00286A430E|nr:helix-turn-helix domain-containing protein [Tabrizicola sp.]